MNEDYERKYHELSKLYSKQQETIKKLQAEIRERCQSYLLHASRFKKTNSSQAS